ncbi:T9SS type A sorting domain-containing protein [Crocinitomicaceae bacterium]|nr:T9SS type A sorting domain-containing protein [Crocinitomicaceae bacterium]
MILKNSIFFVFICFVFFSFEAQKMELAPLSSNPYVSANHVLKSTSIDSTFIYYTDTINLPFFDNFTFNKIQEYTPDYSNPSTTSELYYLIVDQVTGLPISNENFFTNQVTFHRYIDLANDTYSDTVFTPLDADIADFTSYPVQYSPLALYPPYYIYDTIGTNDIPDTIWIQDPPYFQDSVRQFFMPVSDSDKLWVDNHAYHNFRFGLNPQTLGVMTFDGLDANGYPYAIGTSTTGYADYLTSKPIDLSVSNLSDSLYISFLYQPAGLGDEPESSDSLVLEFYSQNQNQWFHIWSDSGNVVGPFKMVHIPVLNANYFSDAFQFRFKNYGGLSGSLDHFHLDMVSFKSTDYTDTLFSDFSFVYPLNTLIDKYTSVPWDHYKSSTDNKMTDSLNTLLYNGYPVNNYTDGSIEVFCNGFTQGTFVLPGIDLAEGLFNYAPYSYANSFHDLTNGLEFSKSLIGISKEFEVLTIANAQTSDYQPNDSTRFTQGFYNYYSYDDGSAEAAFGPTGAQARLAVHFEAYEADSIIGIDLSFVPSVNDVSDKLFLLTVWDDDNGTPGNVLYEDDVFSPRSPIYANEENIFTPYFFVDTQKVAVGNSFFVGWRQLDPERLNLGFDRNIDNSNEIFYSVDGGGNWLISPFEGSAMLRPIFSTGMDVTLGIENISHEDITVDLFPNPTSHMININVPDRVKGCKKLLIDGYGRILKETFLSAFDLSEMNSGIYFISIPELSSSLSKVIKF